MATHVALLRGINVGGHNRLPMAELKAVAEGLGWRDVSTYIQSGNLLFTPGSQEAGGSAELAAELEEGIERVVGFTPPALVLTAAELAAAAKANPFSEIADGKKVHAFFSLDGPAFSLEDAAQHRREAVAEACARAGAKGSQDRAELVGQVLYLHTPDGLGRSLLAAELTKRSGGAALRSTARNWATVTKLLELLAAT